MTRWCTQEGGDTTSWFMRDVAQAELARLYEATKNERKSSSRMLTSVQDLPPHPRQLYRHSKADERPLWRGKTVAQEKVGELDVHAGRTFATATSAKPFFDESWKGG